MEWPYAVQASAKALLLPQINCSSPAWCESRADFSDVIRWHMEGRLRMESKFECLILVNGTVTSTLDQLRKERGVLGQGTVYAYGPGK